jgi:hypothetical protein
MGENNFDGIRRHEDMIREIEAKADEALALALAGSIVSSNAVLDIAHGGTGSSTKNFVDMSTNQFNINGSKLFKASCGFSKESDDVDSGEIAGNIRVISCDEQGADVGPQIRYSGRHTTGDLTPFAFATTAGRKENGDSGDLAGYFQVATTNSDGTISEAVRVNSVGDMGLGVIPALGAGNRLSISGGDVFIDRVGGTRAVKLEIGETVGRVQAIKDVDGDDSESLVMSVNCSFSGGLTGCDIDNITGSYGTAVVEVRSQGAGETVPGGQVRFLVGGADTCPTLRGYFSENGLDVIGDAYITDNVIAGGLSNVVSGLGNENATAGFITGENIKFGAGSPEGAVYARIGAIYGRTPEGGSDDPGENSTLWVKAFNDGGNTGWVPVALGTEEMSICVQTDCPPFATATDGTETPECPVWFDRSRNIWFYWDPNVVRTADSADRGAWLSCDIFQASVPITGRSHTQQFKRQIDKDYDYIMPTRVLRENVNLFLVDLTAALRVSNNGNDPDSHYYTFDLVTLKKRQGDPVRNRSTRQEWPGDREAFEVKRDNLRADGHTLHPNLSDDLVALSSATPEGPPADGTGSITAKRNNRRVLEDSSQNWTDSQWKERENDDRQNNLPANNGFRVQMTSGNYAGVERTIRDNTETTLILRRPWPRLTLADSSVVKTPDVGDTYEILDSQHRKIIARISTKGNVFPDGAHVDPDEDRNSDPPPLFDDYALDEEGNTLTRAQVRTQGQFKTRDVQDFVRSVQNGLAANEPGGSDDQSTHYIALDHYIDFIGAETPTGTDTPATGPDESEVTDATCLAGLWDAVRTPGRLAGVISVTYRLALPPSVCIAGTNA